MDFNTLRLRLFLVICDIIYSKCDSTSIPSNIRSVQQCPMDNAAWNAKAETLHCNASSTYHCMRKIGGGFAEFCLQSQGQLSKDGCPMLHEITKGSKIIQVKCRESSSGCPNTSANYFSSDELYKYPACLENETTGHFTRNRDITAKKVHGLAAVSDKNSRESAALAGGIIAAVIFFVLLVVAACGLKRYVKRLRREAQEARYTDVPFLSLAVRNSHHYSDTRTYVGIERNDQCRGAEGGMPEKKLLTLVVPDDTCRVSCARTSIYDSVREEDEENESSVI